MVNVAEAVTSEQRTISESSNSSYSSNPFRKEDAVDLSTMEEEPWQPKLGVYPPVSKSKTEKGKLVTKRRDFQPTWFERFPWLEFSLGITD